MKVFNDWASDRSALSQCADFLKREAESAYLPLFEPDLVPMPKAFGKYELGDLIGEGMFGVVYSCLQTQSLAPFAIKIIRAEKIHDKEVRARFLREMRALKAVRNPNIIALHDDNLDSEMSVPAFIMDLAETSLHDYITEKAKEIGEGGERPFLDRDKAVSIFSQILAGVEALHSHARTIIHRDINPGNILRLPDGTWVLADFSLAKFLTSSPVTTTFSPDSSSAWVTEGYAAPEQYRDFKGTDHRADIYALGVLLWELFSAAWPPRRPDFLALPESLEPICAKATSWEADDRYASVGQLAEAFEQAVRELQ